MKFVLGLVAFVLAGLVVYVYTGKDYKQPQKQTVDKTVKEIPSKEVVTSVEKKVSTEGKPVVQHRVKKESLKVESTSSEVQNTSSLEEEDFIEDNPLLDNGKIVDIEEESPEKIMQFEIESGLADDEGVENTPLETGKIEL